MTTIINAVGTVLPSSPSNGQLFYQIGVGPQIFYSPSWHALDQTAIDFLTILSSTQNTQDIKTGLGATVTETFNQTGTTFSNQLSLDLAPLITALTQQSNNLVHSVNDVAGFIKALGVITEYWHQMSQVNVARVTGGVSTIAINEPLVNDHPIVPAHNSAQTLIQS